MPKTRQGHALAALKPLQEAGAPDLAKLVIRHTRKSGGELVDAGRGSSAFAGEADILVSMSRAKGTRPTVRQLDAIGRFSAIPPRLLIEQVIADCSIPATGTDPPLPELIETYQVVQGSTVVDPANARAADQIARALPATRDEAQSVSDLAKATELPDRSVRHGLDQLVSRVVRVGTGRRGDPYRFFIPATPDS